MQLSIFIPHPFVSIHQITITIHNNILCAIQLQFLYVHFSLITTFNLLQYCNETDSQPDTSMLPDRVILC